MAEKRIAETLNVRINLGNFQHIELTKYAEKKIEYESNEEMQKKEDELTDELLSNTIRSMRRIPERLGKKTNAVAEVEERIIKEIPRWLEDEPEPNIANEAKEKHNSVVSKQKDNKEKEEVDDLENISKSSNKNESNLSNEEDKKDELPKKDISNDLDDDLFDDKEVAEKKAVSNDLNDDNLFNDDDDLFN